MRNPCRQEPLLGSYLDGELTEDQTAALRMHIADCSGCRRTLEGLRQTDALVRDLPLLEPSKGFDRTFWEKIEALENKNRFRMWARNLFKGWRPVWAGAVAGLAVAVMIYVGGTDPLNPEEVYIAQHMEFLEDYDLIGRLDMLELFDATDAMKEPS